MRPSYTDGISATGGNLYDNLLQEVDMQFHVGPVVYRLILADRRLYDEESNELEGRALEAERLIVISPVVELQRRSEVVRHELAHCFEFHFPPPHNAEERAQFFATISQQFERDIDAAGGASGLEKLPTTRITEMGKSPVARQLPQAKSESFGKPDRMTCSTCEGEVMCGSIVNGEPVLHEYTNRIHVERHMVCDSCGTLTVWTEIASPDGQPTGELVPHPRPTMIRGVEASQWLADKRLALAGAHVPV